VNSGNNNLNRFVGNLNAAGGESMHTLVNRNEGMPQALRGKSVVENLPAGFGFSSLESDFLTKWFKEFCLMVASNMWSGVLAFRVQVSAPKQ
jgi:hypothetical protein